MFERFKALKRISELEERVSECERRIKTYALDADDLYDRWKRLSSRVAKRDEREQNQAESQETTVGEEGNGVTPLTPTFSTLSQRQRRIQMQIIQRRKQNGG